MRNEPDASWHSAREHEIVEHVQRLLSSQRFVVDTSLGQRPVTAMKVMTKAGDRSEDLKRLMSQHRPDRKLESAMPVSRSLEAVFSINKWWVFQKIVGRLLVVVAPPTREILHDQPPHPMTAGETRRALASVPPPLPGVPTTLILVSTSGFAPECHELAERTSERTIILVEPNESGGWSVHGSTEITGVLDLLDPEDESTKEKRVHAAIDLLGDELVTGSLSAEKVALETELPLQRVEDAVKSYAKQKGGLVAKRLDGRLLLYREGSTPQGKAVGGEGMSLVDRIKTLFNRKGDTEKKIAFLSERRAALSQQRDTSNDELFKLEKKESTLKKDFRENESPHARRRITAEMVQLRKEIERRQQLQAVVNQQINIVGTHLHNLELLHQGKSAKLPSTDDIATDAAAAEDMLAQLQADSELADSSGSAATSGMSNEEQALYEELMREVAPTPEAPMPEDPIGAPAQPAEPAKTQAAPPSRTKPASEPG